MEHRFILSSVECETLLAFEKAQSLKDLADLLGKDISVVSRNIKAIAEKSEVLEKQDGRWALTQKGKALNQWTQEAIFSQKIAMNKKQHIKIGTTREFATRILLPKAADLFGRDEVTISIVSTDRGIEELILRNEIDFGFDCGRPVDPMISFERVINEPWAAVASPKFIQEHGIKKFTDLKRKDLLKFARMDEVIWNLDVQATQYYASFSDIASLRQACIFGYGWSILPYYTVKKEIKDKVLKKIPGLKLDDERYGVWWSRDRKSIEPWARKAVDWLGQQSLA